MIRVCAFLGNFGREHRGNRHNVAWHFLESLACFGELRWERKFKGRYASREQAGLRVHYIAPETYMNASGDSVAELARFYQILPEEILALHDELEMAFGSFGFKFGGGLGGHNGLRSLEARLGTRDFARLRFGIGRPDHDDVAGYVLSDFSREERELLDSQVFPRAREAFGLCFAEGFEVALRQFAKVKALD